MMKLLVYFATHAIVYIWLNILSIEPDELYQRYRTARCFYKRQLLILETKGQKSFFFFVFFVEIYTKLATILGCVINDTLIVVLHTQSL